MIKFSIIVPHYNIPDKLERLLKTIPLERSDLEVIIIDDRSDEKLEELKNLKRKYEEKGVLFFKNNNGNKGAGHCRNIGLKHAKGSWIIFADSDDFFTDRLDNFLNENSDRPEELVIFKADSIYDETGEPASRHFEGKKYIEDYLREPSREHELKLRLKMIGPVQKMIKADFLKNNGIFFDSSPVSNDVMFSVKTGLSASNIYVSEEVIYVMTDRMQSLVKKSDKESQRVRTAIFIKQMKYIRNNLNHDEFILSGVDGVDRTINLIYSAVSLSVMVENLLILIKNGINPFDFKKAGLVYMIRAYYYARKERKERS